MASGEEVREASLCDKSKHSTLLETFYLQKNESKFCDVVMKVCNRQIHAHSNVLAAASPYFENFLSLELPRQFSQRSPQIIEIQVDGNEPNQVYEEAVEDVINFIYTGLICVRNYNVSQIHEISKIMQLDSVMDFCEDFLQGKVESNTIYDSTGVSQMRDSINNTDITALNFPPVPELWSTWCKNAKDQNTMLMFPKSKYKKMVSVSVQTTPVDFKNQIGRNKNLTSTLVREMKFVEPVLLNASNERKRPRQIMDNTPEKGDDFVDKTIDMSEQIPNPIAKKPKKDVTLKNEIDNFVNQPVVKPGRIVTRSGRIVVPKRLSSSELYEVLSPAKSKVINFCDTSLEKPPQAQESADKSDILEKQKCAELDDGTEVQDSYEIDADKVDQNCGIKDEDKNDEGKHLKTFEVVKVEEPNNIDSNISKVTKKQSELSVDERILSFHIQDKSVCPSDRLEEETTTETFLNLVPKLPNAIKSINDIDVNENDLESATHSFNSKKRGRPKKISSEAKSPFRTIKVEFEKSAKEYSCAECDYSTTKVREMSSHMKSHKIDDGVCFYCDMMFNDKEQLSSHLQTHKGTAPFVCTECDSCFKTRTMLNLHLPKHSDQKPFLCQVCSMAFKWKHALKNHMVTHSNKREHLCDICGYSTAHKAQLKSHRLIHTGETFKCEVMGCKFETTKKQNLKYHEITHTRERPHQCEICGQNFSLLKNMKRHMLLHFAEKAHRCKSCDFASTRYDKLKEHMLKQHGVGTPPERRIKVADMLATSNINIDVQPDRFISAVSGDQKSSTLVIEPIPDSIDRPSVEDIENGTGVSLSKTDPDTYAILHKLLHNGVGTGTGLVNGDQKITLLQKDGETTQVVVQKVMESEQMEGLPEEQHVLQQQITEVHTDVTNSTVELVNDQPLDTVTSIMLAPDGSQVININGEQCGLISVEELATKLGLPENINLSSLLKPASIQGGDEMGVVISTGEQIQECDETNTLSFATASSSDGILINNGNPVEMPIHIGKQDGDTIQYMEVLVPDSSHALNANMVTLS